MGVRREPIGGGILALVGVFVLAQSVLVLPTIGLYDYQVQAIDPPSFTPTKAQIDRATDLHDDVVAVPSLEKSARKAVQGALSATSHAVRVDPTKVPDETYVSTETRVYQLSIDRSSSDTDESFVVLSADRLEGQAVLEVIAVEPDRFRDRWETEYRITERPVEVLEQALTGGTHTSFTSVSISNSIVEHEGAYYRISVKSGDTASMLTLLAVTTGIAGGFGCLAVGTTALVQSRWRLPRVTGQAE